MSNMASGSGNVKVQTHSNDGLDEYLSDLALRYSPADVCGYLEKIKNLKVLVVGEAIIDEYQYCAAIGKSSKEPILVVKLVSAEKFAGGALSIANHVAGFCDNVGLITMVGAVNTQEDFIRANLNPGIDVSLFYRKDSPTILKKRFVDSYYLTKVMEIYDINDGRMDINDNITLCAMLSREIPKYDLVIVSDFGHSMMTSEAIDIIARKSRFLALNTQSNAGNLGFHTVSKYPRADFITLAEKEVRLEMRDHDGELKPLIVSLANRMKCRRLIVTRGSSGCICYEQGMGFIEAPSLAHKIVDRIGAGDALLSITSLCARRDTPLELVAFIGNAAGAQKVATMCNKEPVSKVKMVEEIYSLLQNNVAHYQMKYQDLGLAAL